MKGTSKTVLEAVRTSINPRVIDCPNPSSGQTRLTAVARDGIAVAVRARVTVRTNLDLFVGGRHGGNGGRINKFPGFRKGLLFPETFILYGFTGIHARLRRR